jgi:hypothetical protein
MEAWVKVSAFTTSNAYIIGKGFDGTKEAYFLRINNNQLQAGSYSGANYMTSWSISGWNVNEWHHVAGLYDGTAWRAYFDGVQKSSTNTASGPLSNTMNVSIGAFNSSSGSDRFFSGLVDDARISNSARYTSNFTPSRRFTEDANTVGLWHFDEGSCEGASPCYVKDSSQYANNGQLMNGSSNSPAADGSTNGPIFVSGSNAIMDGFVGDNPDTPTYQSTGGKTGAGNLTLGAQSSTTSKKSYEVKTVPSSGLRFDGSNDYVAMAENTILEPTNPSAELWLKTTSTATSDVLNLTSRYLLRISPDYDGSGKIAFAYNRSGGWGWYYCRSTSVVTNGAWHHVAGVFDSTNANFRIYVDGNLENTCAAPGTIFYTTGDYLTLGSNNGGQFFLNGSLDEVRISNAPRYSSNFTPSRRFATDANTVGLWHLDDATGTSAIDSSGNGNTGTLMNGSSNSPAADGTTNGPIWTDGLATTSGQASSNPWALPGYQYRQRLKITNNVASTLNPGYGVESTLNRGTLMDNNQMRADGNDTRVVYQPANQTSSVQFNSAVTGQEVKLPGGIDKSITSQFTFEFWFKTPGPSLSGFLFDTSGANINNGGIRAESYSGYVRVCIGHALNSYECFVANTKPTPNIWNHIAIVNDGSKIKFYQNGVSQQSTSNTAYYFNSVANCFVLGNYCDGAASFNGSLDEFRISNVARYKGNFTPLNTPFSPDSNTLALYHLDEGSGQNVTDSSGNGNNGVFGRYATVEASYDPTWSTDGAISTTQEVPREIPHGHALSFNGGTNNARNSTQILTTGPFTTELWYKPTDFASQYTLWSQGSVTGSNLAIKTTTTGKVAFQVDGTTLATGTTSLVANTWNHIALTYNANASPKAVLYLNGKKEATQNIAAVFTGANQTTGASSKTTADEAAKGQIDEVRVSTTVRYRSNFTPTTNPFARDQYTKALWHFDDGSGNATDNSGNGYTLTVTGATWVTNGGKVDSINQTQFKTIAPIAASGTDSDYYLYYGNLNEKSSALSYSSYGLLFDGVNDYVDAGVISALNTNKITLSFWWNRLSATDKMLVGPYNLNHRFTIQPWNDGHVWLAVEAGSATYASATYGTLGWHHFVMVYDGTQSTDATKVLLFIDGVNQTVGTWSTAVPTSHTTSAFRMGMDYSNGNRYGNGPMDDVRIYTRALSASEIAALYTNTPSVSNSGLVGWWKLDDTTPAGTTAIDSSGSGNHGTLTNFNFDQNSNWVPNATLLHATTEPTVSTYSAIVEQESPVFFQYRGSTGGPTPTYDTWSTRAPISASLQQLGSTGVYLRWNPQGSYSTYDTYRINSLAIESFGPTRGKLRTYPAKTNLVANNGGLDIIDASTNKLWARFTKASNNLIGANNILKVKALNGRLYVGSADGLTDIQLDDDTALRFTSSGNSMYQSTLANRDAALAYPAAGGTALNSTTVNDVSPAVVGTALPKQYVALATASDINVVNNITGIGLNSNAPTDSPMYKYAQTASDAYTKVFMTNQGSVYGANTTHAGLDVYTTVNADVADQVGSTDRTYSTASTPALRSNTINSISITTGTSLADYASNTVALGTDLGAEVIQEHSTQANGFVDHYVTTGDTGTSNYTSKNFGNALQFDGTNDYAKVPNSASLQPGTSDFTVEAWIKTSADAGSVYSRSIIDAYGMCTSPYTNGLYNLGILGSTYTDATKKNYLRFTVRDNAGSTFNMYSSGVINDGKWHHIVGVRTATGAKLFIDGALTDSSSMATGSITFNSPVFIGVTAGYQTGAPDTSRAFNGLVDEIRISNTARYSAPFTPPRAEFTADANTIGLWHFDERYGGVAGVSGQPVYDSSSNANNGTLGADAAIATDDPMRVSPSIGGTSASATAVGLMKSGDSGGDLSFDGVNDYVNVSSSTVFNFSAYTLEVWIKLNALPASTKNAAIISRWGNTGAGNAAWSFNVYDTGKIFFQNYNGSSGSTVTGVTALTTNLWYHIAVVWSGGTTGTNAYIFINGKLDTSATMSVLSQNSTYPLNFGKYPVMGATNVYLNGIIDDARIYNRALTGAEIAGLYNGGLGRTDNPYSGIVGWWKMNDGSGQTVTDSSGQGNNGTLGASSTPASDDPTWSTGSPVKNQSALWVGTANGVTGISLNTQRQITYYTTANSGLPSNNVSSLGLGVGGLAIVGTDAGAWPTGQAGFPVDDTALSAATSIGNVRDKGGSIRIKGGSVRIKPK